ncbi:helix-turn-helix transcriptional regulator [Poseidonocella sp. HB161398]|uniref:helix-turn-helix transcriptional regulator n=1 Tax=Poseidonocella sp. HB161398 TaxID=2320855 RepID=UPI0014874680|nr:helix-turn-helix transcriptional regulator [Poseidonocella sp. HB161398]
MIGAGTETGPRAGEAGWELAQRMAQRLGIDALNAVGSFTASGAPIWLRYGMKPVWVDAYLRQRMFEVDPVISWLGTRSQSAEFSGAELALSENPRARDMAALLREHGYGHLVAHKWSDGSVTKSVLLCTRARAQEVLPPETLAILPAVSAMMAAQLSAPESGQGFQGVAYRPLSGRERDVLCLLAAGLDNRRIAEKLGLAEVTVRMHLAKAREKMGAATREQALVLAMARGLLGL